MQGLIAWFGRRHIARQDDAERRINYLEKTAVGRQEFQTALAELGNKIEQSNRATHARLDQIILLWNNDHPRYQKP